MTGFIRALQFALIGIFAAKVALDLVTTAQWFISLPATAFMLFNLEYSRFYDEQRPVCPHHESGRCLPCFDSLLAYMEDGIYLRGVRAVVRWSGVPRLVRRMNPPKIQHQAMACFTCGLAGFVPADHFPQTPGAWDRPCPACDQMTVWVTEIAHGPAPTWRGISPDAH